MLTVHARLAVLNTCTGNKGGWYEIICVSFLHQANVMRIRLLLAVCVCCFHAAYAQKVKEYPVKAGEVPDKVLPNEARYVLQGFTAGTATLKNSTSAALRFNYNFLLDEMHFINERGDTLAIADPLMISSVVIDQTLFYYDKGYLREILKQGAYKLAVRQRMIQIPDKTRGGYDIASGVSSIQTYASMSGSTQIYHLEVKKDVLLRVDFSFYIADVSGHFVKASNSNFHILFSGKEVTKYLKAHKVDFDKEEDLIALFRFCTE